MNDLGALVQRDEVQSKLYHQVLALQSLSLHMIKMIERYCVDVKTCVQNIKPELCCDHSAWDIVPRADAIQWANVVIPLNTW